MSVEIKIITYEEQRLQYFSEMRDKAKKRFEKLNKQYKMNTLGYLNYSAYMELSEKLSHAGMVLSFYNNVVEMCEKALKEKQEKEKQRKDEKWWTDL